MAKRKKHSIDIDRASSKHSVSTYNTLKTKKKKTSVKKANKKRSTSQMDMQASPRDMPHLDPSK